MGELQTLVYSVFGGVLSSNNFSWCQNMSILTPQYDTPHPPQGFGMVLEGSGGVLGRPGASRGVPLCYVRVKENASF